LGTSQEKTQLFAGDGEESGPTIWRQQQRDPWGAVSCDGPGDATRYAAAAAACSLGVNMPAPRWSSSPSCWCNVSYTVQRVKPSAPSDRLGAIFTAVLACCLLWMGAGSLPSPVWLLNGAPLSACIPTSRAPHSRSSRSGIYQRAPETWLMIRSSALYSMGDCQFTASSSSPRLSSCLSELES
jgi:hypothetical protein